MLNVPESAVGGPAHCPHCKTNFQIPANPDGSPGEPVVSTGQRLMLKVPDLLIGPAFGLIAAGAIGAAVNGLLLTIFLIRPGADKDYAMSQVLLLRTGGLFAEAREAARDPDKELPEPDLEELAREEAENEAVAEAWATYMVPVHAAFLPISLLAFAGGIAMLTSRYYWLAVLGCFAAMINLNNMCCIPGGISGLWGLLVLIRDDGRACFRGK